MANDLSGYPVYLEYAHHLVHHGRLWEVSDEVTLGNGGTQNYLIITPSTGIFNLDFEIDPSGGTKILFKEGAVATTVGATQLIEVNNNRLIGTTNPATGLQVWKTPTITSAGTQIRYRRTGGNVGSGGDSTSTATIVLLPNTQYIVTLTSEVASNTIGFVLVYHTA